MDANEIFDRDWAKMSKVIMAISEAIKSHCKASSGVQMPDHELLLISMQVFSLICSRKWGFAPEEIQRIWKTSQDIHKLVQATSTDNKVKDELQKYVLTKPKQFSN